MKTFSVFLQKISNWKSLLFVSIIYMFLAGFVLNNAEKKIDKLSGKSIGVIDLKIGYKPQKTLEMAQSYSESAKNYYSKIEMSADVIYPLIYAFLLGIILSLIFPSSILNTFPFLITLFDYLENFTIVELLSNPTQAWATYCEVFKLIKWLLLFLTLIFILFGIIKKLRKTL